MLLRVVEHAAAPPSSAGARLLAAARGWSRLYGDLRTSAGVRSTHVPRLQTAARHQTAKYISISIYLYLYQMGTEIFKIEEEMTEKMKSKVANPPSKNQQNSLLPLCTPLMILCIFMTCNESKTCSTCW